jgi:HD-GYP domain-containing protein (c-di-GMP phosphodiesterase class II)
MITGKKLFGRNGEMILNSGAVLSNYYIDRLRELGYGGLYIDDELSRDIEIVELISDELRMKAVKAVKEIFSGMEKQSSGIEDSLQSISNVVGSIIDDVLSSKETMINMLDLKTFDDYTYLHSTNVAVLAVTLGISMNFNKVELQRLGLASILHDIGKVFIPKIVLNKPGRLTEEEALLVQTHSNKGYEYLKGHFDFPIASYQGILQHHEKFDGTGYPIKLEGQNIHLYGRVIAVADVYDALTSNRPYREALLPSEALEYIMANGGKHFDPAVVDFFRKKISPYPVGLTVRLSNNTTGIVCENYPNFGLRPRIKIIRHVKEHVTPYYVDLKNDPNTRNITIVGIDNEEVFD